MQHAMGIEARVGEQFYAPDGSQVYTESRDPYERVCVSSTSFHEGIHAFLLIKHGVGLRTATREPGPGYKGMVDPNGFDGVAAVGPSAVMGPKGCGHDIALAASKSVNIGAAQGAARQEVFSNIEDVERTAAVIEQRGTVTGNELERELERGDDVLVHVKRHDGTIERSLLENVKGPTVMVPFQEYSLSQAA